MQRLRFIAGDKNTSEAHAHPEYSIVRRPRDWVMTVDEMLKRYGLKPQPKDLPAIREELSREIDRDPCNEPLMCLCCVQLFACGLPEDAVLIWRAKLRTFDMA